MAGTRSTLREITANVDESMGVRRIDSQPRLSPVPSAKDIGRTPLRKFGRLNVEQIVADPRQPRGEFDEEEIQQLAASIRSTGQLHPIRVCWNDAARKWVIVTGERRYRATIAAGLTKIDCYFHEEEITESETLEQQLVENLLRQDLKPLEEARGYAALMDLNGWNGKQVAETVRVSPSKVSQTLALLDLPQDVQQQVETGAIPRTTAYELSKLGNESTQRDLAGQAASGALNHEQTSKAIRQRRGKKAIRSQMIKLEFPSENGWKLIAVHKDRSQSNYHELLEAVDDTKAEINLRIKSNIQLNY